ncbi:hypothetical protein JCM1840_006196 [Sporobolomyces johnsonii]
MSLLLGQPLTFPRSGKVAPTHTLKSAMTERLSTYDQDNHDERGKPTPLYENLYRVWGEGRIGVIVLGNVPVDRTSLEAPRNAIIDPRSSWDAVEAFRPAIAAAKAHGSLVIAQLTMGGRQTPTLVTPTPVSSSDVQAAPMGGLEFGKPRPLEVEEIDWIVAAFVNAAKKLYEAGADGVQLHSAHGYLLSQFLSSRVNRRTDDYGGSLENRARILLRIVDGFKKELPKDFILSIKINSADFSDGGLTLEESRQVCIWLDEAGLDLIELSGGTYESLSFGHKKESTVKREAYFVEFAEVIKPHIKTARICVTGGFRSKKAMEDALQQGSTDLIGLARPLTAEPYLIKDIIEGKSEGAKENHADGSFTTITSIVQMGAIAKGEPIPDLSDKEVVEKIIGATKGGLSLD